MQTINLPSDKIQLPLQLINKALGHCTVYAFGYRTAKTSYSSIFQIQQPATTNGTHFDLLIFSNDTSSDRASVIANQIAEQSAKEITATILLHKLSDLNSGNHGQQWFFDKVIRLGHRLHLNKEAIPYLPTNGFPTYNTETNNTFWLKCIAVAQFNIQAAKENPQLEVALCKIALLNTACTQIALGLIKVFIGYYPNQFGLNHLLQLCTHFTNLPAHIFPQYSPVQQKRYKMLCAPPSMLNHYTKLHAPEDDLQYLLTASQDFLDQAIQLVNNEHNN